MEIVCYHCRAINRVPDERLRDQPVCGVCKKPFLAPEPIDLTSENFDALIERSELPVLVDFWAPWCGPCLSMAPAFAEAAGILHGRAILAKLDTEAYPAIAARFSIRSIPTVALFHLRRELAREAGARSAPSIVSWTENLLSGLA